MVNKTAPKPKLIMDVVGELATLMVQHPINSVQVQKKMDELSGVAREIGQLPPYDTGFAAAKDALGQVFGQLLRNLPGGEKIRLENQFATAFRQEFMRLAPHVKIP